MGIQNWKKILRREGGGGGGRRPMVSPPMSTNLLEIIHTNICCPDMDANGLKYFITFIDDYSRYMYLYLLCSKDEALSAFKVFKVEVENQCVKHIKIVR